jgi:hypothetical protein
MFYRWRCCSRYSGVLPWKSTLETVNQVLRSTVNQVESMWFERVIAVPGHGLI